MHLFNVNRVFMAAQGVGVAQGALEMAIATSEAEKGLRRDPFQAPGGAVQDRRDGDKDRSGPPALLEGCLAHRPWQARPGPRLHGQVVRGGDGRHVANEALQLHGGYGYIAEYDIQRFYRDAKIVEIYEGAREMEKQTIAREILGGEIEGQMATARDRWRKGSH